MSEERENANSAGQCMKRDLMTIGFEESLDEAFRVMRDKKIRHLPVVDGLGDVIGILSDRDLQRAMSPQYDKDSPREMSFKFDTGFCVKDFMSWPVQTVHHDTMVLTAAKKMLLEKISAFLVEGDSGPIEGIITTDDLLRVLISLLEKGPTGARLTLKGFWSEFGMSADFG